MLIVIAFVFVDTLHCEYKTVHDDSLTIQGFPDILRK